jgi:hypothetical protein
MGGVYRRSLAPELSVEKRGLGASAVPFPVFQHPIVFGWIQWKRSVDSSVRVDNRLE